MLYKRLSTGKFRWWPRRGDEAVTSLAAHELQVLLFAGDPSATHAAPAWRPVTPRNAEVAFGSG